MALASVPRFVVGHLCCHFQTAGLHDGPLWQELCDQVLKQVAWAMQLVRPSLAVHLAMDGVAPAAVNQRSKCFREALHNQVGSCCMYVAVAAAGSDGRCSAIHRRRRMAPRGSSPAPRSGNCSLRGFQLVCKALWHLKSRGSA